MGISLKKIVYKKTFHILRFTLLLFILTSIIASLAGCGSAKVTVSPLTISPDTVSPSEKVTIAVNILNLEKKAVEGYQLNLTVNGALKETKTVTLAADQTTTYTFDYVPDTTGSYNVDINGQPGTFKVVHPASFQVGQLTISPDSPTIGQEVMASADVKNEGELPGTYTATFKVDDNVAKTVEIKLEPGQTAPTTANFTLDTSGTHVIAFGDVTRTVKVLKPAEFEATSINVSPASIVPGETAIVSANITNSGDTRGTFPVAVMVNGTESSSQSVSLDPGASTTVDFTISPGTTGTVDIKVLDSSTTLNAVALMTYSDTTYFYTISYPSDFQVNEIDPDTTSITKSDYEIISVLVDKISIASTAKDYFDDIAEGKKQQLPDWTYTSLTEIKEDNTIVGYRYDYTNTAEGKKWIGRGMVVKKGGLGFYVVFTTTESEWEKNKAKAPIILDSFVSPGISTGYYSNPANGITLTLTDEWTAIDTDQADNPLVFMHLDPSIFGGFGSEAVSSDTLAQQYVLDNVAGSLSDAGFIVKTKGPFKFDNSETGYEATLSFSIIGKETFKVRVICLKNDNRMYALIFMGSAGSLDAQTSSITRMAKSLVISAPGTADLDKNETLFLLEGEIPTLDPALFEEASDGIAGAIFSGLVRIDKNLKVVPDLAEKWTVSPDGKTYTFYLRKNAKFHSGKPVTAADVKYSWERACSPALKAPKAVYFLNDIVGATDMIEGKATEISGIKVIDDYTLEATIDTPKQYFLQKLAQPIAYIVNRDNVAKGDKWYETPDGTGPFMLLSWVKDSQIILVRNEDFYEGPVKLKNIMFKIFAGLPMILYENGEIDIASVGLTDQERVLNTSDPLNKQLLTGNAAELDYLGFNVTKPPFDDPKVRKAFALALDVNKLLEVSLKGRADRAAGYIPQSVPGYNSSLQPMPYDVNRAKQLIAESKYQSVDKLPAIKFAVIYGTSPLQQAIIGMWQQNLGVQVTVETVTEVKTWMDRLRNHEFQVFTSGWRADYLDPQNFLEVLFQSQSTENHFAYANTQIDELLAQAGIDNNEETRIEKYQDIEKQILEDLPAVPLFRNDKIYVLVKPWVKGFTTLPLGVGQWRDIYIEAH
jgi:oligopeptide transport system substrate-binding protein